jgi:predicted DNA-binding transcriptional regulator AlpA
VRSVNSSTAQPLAERIYSWPEARPLFGNISRTTAWRLVRQKTLPRPVQVSPNRIGWRHSDIVAWQAARASDRVP